MISQMKQRDPGKQSLYEKQFNTTHNLNLIRTDLVDALRHQRQTVSIRWSSILTDWWSCYGVSLEPYISSVFMLSIEDTLEREEKLPSFYRRYVDYTLTVMPDLTTATTFLPTLNSAYTSVKFTVEVEKNGKLPSLAPNYSTMHLGLKPRFIRNQNTQVHYVQTIAINGAH